MKKIVWLATLCVFAFSAPVLAKGNSNSPWYLGIKGGFMSAGDSGVTSNPINFGFNLGYQNNRYLSTEIELTETMFEGDNNGELSTLSAFAALRTRTPVKVKGKIGFSNIAYGNNGDWELSMGFGIGFWAAGGLTEIEYTKVGDNLDFISVGVNFFY